MSIGAIMINLSLAEMCSIGQSILYGGHQSPYDELTDYRGLHAFWISSLTMTPDPVVGAQYRWSAKFAPAWPRFWGLLQGWLTILAWVTATAASPAFLSFGVQSLISLWHPSYPYPAWHTTLLMISFTIPPVVANLWFRKIINPMEGVGAIVHAAFFIAAVILLGVAGPRNPQEHPWTDVS